MKIIVAMLGSALLVGVPAVAQDHAERATVKPAAEKMQVQPSAIAVIHALGDSGVKGTVRFTPEGDGVKVVAEVEGLKPNTSHGFHIHEFGDCSAPDGSSAGAHYNPEGHSHAGPDSAKRHAGDLGNLQSDDSGKAKLELTMSGISINGEKNPIIGRSVIIHQKQDDLKSQPSGDAGGRIACGVIGIAKP